MEEDNPDFQECEGCNGSFYYGDLQGGLCCDCYDAAFGEDD